MKGHGGDKGNDAADTTATWAQAGGYQNIQNIKRAVKCMQQGTWIELENVMAPYDASIGECTDYMYLRCSAMD